MTTTGEVDSGFGWKTAFKSHFGNRDIDQERQAHLTTVQTQLEKVAANEG